VKKKLKQVESAMEDKLLLKNKTDDDDDNWSDEDDSNFNEVKTNSKPKKQNKIIPRKK